MSRSEEIDIIPGTDVVFKEHGETENATPSDLILIPQPTSNLDDPLVIIICLP
jgi:hypothetical protein